MQRRGTENMMGALVPVRSRAPARSRASLVALGALSLLASCASEAPATNVEVRLSSALGCRPTRIDDTRIEGWGDFPLSNEHIVVSVGAERVSLDGLPRTTSALFVELSGGAFVGRGVAELPTGLRSQQVLVLPSDVSCPLPDPEVRLIEGAAMAMLEDGSLLFVGGLDGAGDALRRVLLLAPGDELAQSDLAPLLNRVAYASVTPLGPREVLVAGGAREREGTGGDTFERLLLDAAVDAPRRVGTLAVGRREQGALALSDGSVLLVGGRSRDAMIDSIERIAEGATTSVLLPPRLLHPRASATLVERSDGSVVIAGGLEGSGPSRAIEVLSPDGLSITEVDLPLPAAASVSVLAGPRLLWIGVDGSVHHVILEDPLIALDAGVRLPVGPLAVSDAGEALVRDPVRAELVLLRRDGTTRRVPSSRGVGALVSISDGTFVELDRSGASRLRPTALSRHAAPPNSYQFPIDVGAVIVDSPTRFAAGTLPGGLGALTASEGGSLDIPVLDFRDVLVTVRMAGTGALRWTASTPSGRRVVLEVTITEEALSVGRCSVPRDPAALLTLTRRGDQLTLDAGLGAAVCNVSLPERVGVGLRLAPGAGVGSISLARLLVP